MHAQIPGWVVGETLGVGFAARCLQTFRPGSDAERNEDGHGAAGAAVLRNAGKKVGTWLYFQLCRPGASKTWYALTYVPAVDSQATGSDRRACRKAPQVSLACHRGRNLCRTVPLRGAWARPGGLPLHRHVSAKKTMDNVLGAASSKADRQGPDSGSHGHLPKAASGHTALLILRHVVDGPCPPGRIRTVRIRDGRVSWPCTALGRRKDVISSHAVEHPRWLLVEGGVAETETNAWQSARESEETRCG